MFYFRTHWTVRIVVVPRLVIVFMFYHLVILEKEDIPTFVITFVTAELSWRFFVAAELRWRFPLSQWFVIEQSRQGSSPKVLSCVLFSFFLNGISFFESFHNDVFRKLNSIVPFLIGGLLIIKGFKEILFGDTFNFKLLRCFKKLFRSSKHFLDH